MAAPVLATYKLSPDQEAKLKMNVFCAYMKEVDKTHDDGSVLKFCFKRTNSSPTLEKLNAVANVKKFSKTDLDLNPDLSDRGPLRKRIGTLDLPTQQEILARQKVKVLAIATYFNYRISEWKSKSLYRVLIAAIVSAVATPVLTVFDIGMVGAQCVRNYKAVLAVPLAALIIEVAGVILFPIVQLIPKKILTRERFYKINQYAANSEDTNHANRFKSFVTANFFKLNPVYVFSKKIV